MKKMVTCNILFLMIILIIGEYSTLAINNAFIATKGTQFLRNGHPFHFNGFNAYWLMLVASNPSTRPSIASIFQEANKYGLTVARTWAFSDGGSSSLQSSPGVYNEDMFKGLDYAISEAKKNGIYLILSLVNNFPDFGGKHQYVQWARDQGQQLKSDDDFYSNSVVKGYYKNHVKTILERKNTITGISYKDDPTIFAWELINEARCETDPSGRPVQEWIQEMAAYVKSIDRNHLLEIGLEGFYGQSRKQSNPHNSAYGTDFIFNNQISEIDFATIHAYPSWYLGTDNVQIKETQIWLQAHIRDSNEVLKKPLVISEFGTSSKLRGFQVRQRDGYFEVVYNNIFESAKSGGSCSGGLFWQMLSLGMEAFNDGYQIVLGHESSTAAIIAQQSRRLSELSSPQVLLTNDE